METLVDDTIEKLKSKVEMAYWQKDAVELIIKETIELAYRQGREDQRYASEGPAISLY